MTVTTRNAFPMLCAFILAAGSAAAQTVELANEHAVLRFAPEDGYALSGLVNVAHETDLIQPRPEGAAQDRSPWRVLVRGTGINQPLTAADARDATHSLQDDTLTITWTGVASEQVPGDLTVTATIRLPQGSRKAFWRIEVTGETTGWLWQVDFPRVFGLRDFPDCQMSLPWYWGRLVRSPMQLGRAASLTYPEPASMQWFAYWGTEDEREPELTTEEGRDAETGWAPDRSDACGLYWAAEDGELHVKRFGWDPTGAGEQLSWHIENIPPLPDWPMPEITGPVEVSYAMPYEAVTAVFTGDLHEAAGLYREWAMQQQWAQRGPMDQWPEETPEAGSEELVRWTPPWFRDIGFWAKFYHEPAKILPEWAAYRKWLQVPMASHWYRYNIAAFNDNDPEHLPPDPYVLEGVRAARELGVEPMPYVLSTIWDTDTQSWILEDGRLGAVESEAGEIRPWTIGNNVFAWMCLSTEQWQAKMRQICEKLIWEHGMSGVYLDVLAAGAPKLCYDPEHGHSIHGGSYWGQGARRLMHDLRAHIRRLDPDACFFTEEIGEHLIDVMDGYLTLDLTRSHTPGGEQVWPVLTAVYHPYTVNFGSDAQIDMGPEQFALLYGRQVVWGSQPLHSVLEAPLPEPGDTTAETFRDYTRAFWVAGQPFLTGGRMLRLATRPQHAPEGRCGLEMAADAHTVRFDVRGRSKIWTGPAVLGSAWERFGDIGIVLVNITGDERTVALTVRPQRLELAEGAQMARLWPQRPDTLGPAAGEHELTLEPWRCAVYVLTEDLETAVDRLNELQDTPWELQVVEDGPFEPISGPAGALFASSDGPVLNAPGEQGTLATAYQFDEQGRLQPRSGHQAERRGGEAEGRGLPRKLHEQPFVLLRRLPHSATVAEPGMMVFSGDEHHLLAAVPGETSLRFDAEGLLVVSNGTTGELVRGLEEPPAAEFTAPEGEGFIVGWARFDEGETAAALAGVEPGLREPVMKLAERLAGLASAVPQARMRELAAASGQFVEIADGMNETPGALSPISPLIRLHERLNALVVAHLGMRVDLQADHRWLAPEVEKPLRLLVQSGTQEEVSLAAVGHWRAGNFAIQQPAEPQVVEDTRVYQASVRLDDGLYVERVVPIIATATVRRGPLAWTVSDILRLEANRPYQLIYEKEPLTLLGGAERSASIQVRNWSPLDLELSLSGSGPEGWQVAPAERRIQAPALSDASFDVAVHAPEGAARGRYDVRVVANHAAGEDSAFIAQLPVSVLDALRPLVPDAEEWDRPEAEQRARIRNSSKFAVYAEEGETIGASIENIRVTRYEDTLTWRLVDPALNVAEEGRIPVDESAEVEHSAQVGGTYYLEVMPGSGSADVRFANRLVAEVATKQDPLQLFTSAITRHFFVPEGAEQFRLGAQDGGAAEGARFVITAPGGRVAFERDGNYNGVEWPVRVEDGEAGKLWQLRVEPRQDIAFWLAGDVMPYLSTSPERALRVEGR